MKHATNEGIGEHTRRMARQRDRLALSEHLHRMDEAEVREEALRRERDRIDAEYGRRLRRRKDRRRS